VDAAAGPEALLQRVELGRSVCEILPALGGLHLEIAGDSYRFHDGYVLPPEKAGLGIELTDEIKSRYPFVPGSPVDVTVDDFGRLFAPGGLLDDFFQKKLAPYVDTTVKPWKFRQLGDASLGGASAGSAASLIQFQRAAEIRNVFFGGGAPGFSVRLEMKPLQMDPALLQFSLDMDGQVLKYAHGPSVPQQMRWPGTRGTNQIRIQVSPSPASGASGLLFEGPWAIFRMFDRAQIQPAAEPERFRSTFSIDGRPVVFDVTTSSVQNPFRLDALKAFRCPTRL